MSPCGSPRTPVKASKARSKSRNKTGLRMTFKNLLNRREMMRFCGMGLLASPLGTMATGCQKPASKSFAEPAGAPYEGSDEQLLDEIQRASFASCGNDANPKTGLVNARALANG